MAGRGRRRRALRVVGVNALLLCLGLATLFGAAEAYLRLREPFDASVAPTRLVPGVGLIRVPGAEVRHTNNLDYWTVSVANSLGFLDREPIAPEEAAASCHVAVIGDSLVEARQVSISDKFHVRMERLAARQLPKLLVTTSAWARGGTGQLNQLPFYDRFVRPSRPKMVLLVFVSNDFEDNSAILKAMRGLTRLPQLGAIFGASG